MHDFHSGASGNVAAFLYVVSGALAKNLKPISQIRYIARMHRMAVLADLVCDEIYEVALAMLDGSYWKEQYFEAAPDYGDRGNFEVGGGD